MNSQNSECKGAGRNSKTQNNLAKWLKTTKSIDFIPEKHIQTKNGRYFVDFLIPYESGTVILENDEKGAHENKRKEDIVRMQNIEKECRKRGLNICFVRFFSDESKKSNYSNSNRLKHLSECLGLIEYSSNKDKTFNVYYVCYDENPIVLKKCKRI